jgi:hypothetical protein
MYTCEDCREQIWDDLFGLLEAGDSARLRHHVVDCATCQAEMATATAQHQLVAAAARLDIEIPPFTEPLAEEAQPVRPIHSDARGVKRRLYVLPWLATAAAILLLTSVPFGFYEYGRLRHQAAWREAEDQVAHVIKERDQLHAEAQRKQQSLVQVALARNLRLQMIGPAAYQPGSVHPYKVWLTDVEGQPVDAPLTARLLLPAMSPVVLPAQKSGANGEFLVTLPANLPLTPDSTPLLEMVAQGQINLSPVQSYLRVLEPAYRTHLATDKPVYHPGDAIYFRSATLERAGSATPERAFTAVYTLADSQGKVYQTLHGRTGKGGIGTGEFTFSPHWPPGEYTLSVAEADKRFPAVKHRLQVRVATDKPARTDPGTSAKLEVEFFPEGGDLLAGVANRVYFRVRTSLGQPADLRGEIIDSKGNLVSSISTARSEGQRALTRGLGSFTLRPRAGETYKVRVTAPEGMEVSAVLPPVQATGVALNLPAAVGGLEEPVHALVQQTEPARNLVVGLFCQGRLVGQELIAAKPGTTEVRLTPTVRCNGVLRVTVFEERQGQLWPVAERLAFRRPEKRLVLDVKAGKENYAPGETIQLHFRTLNEKGEPEPAWLLASVVDQKALSTNAPAAEASLPAYFHLLSELDQPEDLEQADILVDDSREGAAALDLFLGTQGWRRFREPGEKSLAMGNATAARPAQDLAVPAIVKLDNLEQVQRSYVASLSQAEADLHDTIARQDRRLVSEGNERLLLAQAAVQELDGYLDRAGGLVRLGVGLGGVLLFAVACLFLALALIRLARGLAGNKAYLAAAFTALLLCAVTQWGPARDWGRAGARAESSMIARYAKKIDQRLDLAAMALKEKPVVAPSQALSKGRGLLAREAWMKESAATTSDRTNTAHQSQPLIPSVPERRPFIGILGKGAESPPSPPSNKEEALSPLPVRAYAYLASQEPAAGRQLPDTILWQPAIFAADGTAELVFSFPPKAATYRLQIQGHSAAGRLGVLQEKLECRENATGAGK